MSMASRGDDQYVVRFPDGMRDRLKADAYANNRSMNSEIIARLSQSFDGNGGPAKTLRDEFAMAALAGLMSATNQDGQWTAYVSAAAEWAYEAADAMLSARKEGAE